MADLQGWVDVPVRVEPGGEATVIAAGDRSLHLRRNAGTWTGLETFDTVSLVRVTPLGRWWAAVRGTDGPDLHLGLPRPTGADRRRYVRQPVTSAATIWWPGADEPATGRTTDMSVGGFSAQLDREIPAGVTVAARITLGESPMTCIAATIDGRVGRARFAFTQLRPADRDMVAAITWTTGADGAAVPSGPAWLWTSTGSARVTFQATALGGAVTGGDLTVQRGERVVIAIDDKLLLARVVSLAGGRPRLAWDD
ncbi:PilZ domain-containing protein [Catenuloplanes atrovinosus]|uniref:PilZ domain-containing protein n=1 Tax=Catenuloplanes atrovinosus TaxID=137266 RepID=A0AAE3YRZ3_9ACTN|nr:PilZ domain-containing protein [Catenuloplanes atrovinosus]MDR7276681.1 hypothetical protein [Catenuloplanes atrovinosus]